MKSTNDNPLDPLGNLGAPIRPTKPAAPDVVKPFEHGDHSLIGDSNKALESIAETLRKQLPIVSDGQAEDWEGLCVPAPAASVSTLSTAELQALADLAEFMKESA